MVLLILGVEPSLHAEVEGDGEEYYFGVSSSTVSIPFKRTKADQHLLAEVFNVECGLFWRSAPRWRLLSLLQEMHQFCSNGCDMNLD